MKLVKIIFVAIIIVFIGIVFYQNQEIFLRKESILFLKYKISDFPIAVYFIGIFLSGLLISYFFSLADRFKSKKAIKKLNSTVDSQQRAITELKYEIELAKGSTVSENKPA